MNTRMMLSLLASLSLLHAEIIPPPTGPASSLGAAPAKIAPPSDALNQCITAPGQVGFDEAQGVFTPAAFTADNNTTIPSGTLVDSHMILLNVATNAGVNHFGVTWTFKRPIIAVMSDSNGSLEAASTSALGAAATNYALPATAACVPFGVVGAAPFAARGMETTGAAPGYVHTPCPAVPTNDCCNVAGNSITVGMGVAQPGDWIRVITAGALRVAIDIKPGSDPNCFNNKQQWGDSRGDPGKRYLQRQPNQSLQLEVRRPVRQGSRQW